MLKDKWKIQEAEREKWPVMYKRIILRLTVAFASETMEQEGTGMIYLKYWDGKNKKNSSASIFYPAKPFFKIKG